MLLIGIDFCYSLTLTENRSEKISVRANENPEKDTIVYIIYITLYCYLTKSKFTISIKIK